MKLFRFLEYQGFICNGSYSENISDLGLNDNEFRVLKNLSFNLVPKKQIFEFTDTKIIACSLVGSLSFNGINIEIMPKLLRNRSDETDVNSKSVISNLMFMLSYTNKLEVSDTDIGQLSSSENSFIDAYMGIFASRLERHLIRFGTPKTYINKSENLNTIKGKIDFSGNIRQNIFDESKVYCEFNEFSDNNATSQGFKFVALALKGITSRSDTLNKLNRCLGLLDGVTPNYVAADEFTRSATGKRDQNFIALINLASMFLRQLRPEFDGQKNNKVFSILFDMNELFEEFIFHVLKRNEARLGIEVSAQRKRKLVSAERNLLESGEWEERNLFDTFTDIIVKLKNGSKFIIDTKYKLISSSKNHYGISNQDAYQVLAYRQIHQENEIDPKVVLLYPKNSEDIHREFKVNGSDSSFIAWTIDISKDLSTNIDVLISDLRTLIKSVT